MTPRTLVPSFTLTVGDIFAWTVCNAIMLWFMSIVFTGIICDSCYNNPSRNVYNISYSNATRNDTLKKFSNAGEPLPSLSDDGEDLLFLSHKLKGARRHLLDLCRAKDGAVPSAKCTFPLHKIDQHLIDAHNLVMQALNDKLSFQLEHNRVGQLVVSVSSCQPKIDGTLLFLSPLVVAWCVGCVVMVGCVIKMLVEVYCDL